MNTTASIKRNFKYATETIPQLWLKYKLESTPAKIERAYTHCDSQIITANLTVTLISLDGNFLLKGKDVFLGRDIPFYLTTDEVKALLNQPSVTENKLLDLTPNNIKIIRKQCAIQDAVLKLHASDNFNRQFL